MPIFFPNQQHTHPDFSKNFIKYLNDVRTHRRDANTQFLCLDSSILTLGFHIPLGTTGHTLLSWDELCARFQRAYPEMCEDMGV